MTKSDVWEHGWGIVFIVRLCEYLLFDIIVSRGLFGRIYSSTVFYDQLFCSGLI